MRLLDEEDVIKAIQNLNCGTAMQKVRTIDAVEHVPTAYNVDKVVEMLEEECFSPIDYPGYAVDIEEAVKIVEGGGVDGKERI